MTVIPSLPHDVAKDVVEKPSRQAARVPSKRNKFNFWVSVRISGWCCQNSPRLANAGWRESPVRAAEGAGGGAVPMPFSGFMTAEMYHGVGAVPVQKESV